MRVYGNKIKVSLTAAHLSDCGHDCEQSCFPFLHRHNSYGFAFQTLPSAC